MKIPRLNGCYGGFKNYLIFDYRHYRIYDKRNQIMFTFAQFYLNYQIEKAYV